MTFEEIIYDILEIKGAIEDDSDIEEMWILHKMNRYRAFHISSEYSMTNQIDPSWLQRVYKFAFEKTSAADDPNITYNSIDLGKAILPSLVNLPDDIGLYRLAGSSAIMQFEPCDFNRLMMKSEIGEEKNEGYGYYSRVGNAVYITPYIMEGSTIIIADNPMDIKINDGGVLRDMTFADQYPLDPILAQKAVIDLLTKDLQISENAIMDVVNDSQRDFKLMKNEQGVQRNQR